MFSINLPFRSNFISINLQIKLLEINSDNLKKITVIIFSKPRCGALQTLCDGTVSLFEAKYLKGMPVSYIFLKRVITKYFC